MKQKFTKQLNCVKNPYKNHIICAMVVFLLIASAIGVSNHIEKNREKRIVYTSDTLRCHKVYFDEDYNLHLVSSDKNDKWFDDNFGLNSEINRRKAGSVVHGDTIVIKHAFLDGKPYPTKNEIVRNITRENILNNNFQR